MSTRRIDRVADELTDVITTKIEACGDGIKGVEVLIAGTRMHSKSDAFRTLIEREFWEMHQRGIRPGVLQQTIRNVEAWARFGPPNGGFEREEAAS